MVTWRTNVEIPSSPKSVATLIRKRFGGEAGRVVKLLGQGWDCFAYETDLGHVFKIPKRKKAFAALEREIFVLGKGGKSFPIPGPEPRWIGKAGADFPGPFYGYPKLKGRFLSDLDPAGLDLQPMAAQMGRFLSELHRQDLASYAGMAQDFGIPDLANEEEMANVEEAIEALGKWLAHPALGRKAAAYYRTWKPAPPPSQRPVLVHGDLTLGHVLCDPTGNRFSGVIDWGDLGIGQPIGDFFAAFAWGGEDFLREALKHYTGSVGEPDIAWMRQKLFFVGVWEAYYSLDTENLNDRNNGLKALRTALGA
jgi:aminoglycoside 2''-phosphotransferase